MSQFNPNYHKGIRRTIKVYGAVDPVMEARRRRQFFGPIRKPHAGLKTSVKPFIEGDRPQLETIALKEVLEDTVRKLGASTPLKSKTTGSKVRGVK